MSAFDIAQLRPGALAALPVPGSILPFPASISSVPPKYTRGLAKFSQTEHADLFSVFSKPPSAKDGRIASRPMALDFPSNWNNTGSPDIAKPAIDRMTGDVCGIATSSVDQNIYEFPGVSRDFGKSWSFAGGGAQLGDQNNTVIPLGRGKWLFADEYGSSGSNVSYMFDSNTMDPPVVTSASPYYQVRQFAQTKHGLTVFGKSEGGAGDYWYTLGDGEIRAAGNHHSNMNYLHAMAEDDWNNRVYALSWQSGQPGPYLMYVDADGTCVYKGLVGVYTGWSNQAPTSLHVLGPDHIVVYWGYSYPYLMESTDGGTTWTEVSVTWPSGMHQLHRVGSKLIGIASDGDPYFVSEDFGRTWVDHSSAGYFGVTIRQIGAFEDVSHLFGAEAWQSFYAEYSNIGFPEGHATLALAVPIDPATEFVVPQLESFDENVVNLIRTEV